MLCTDSTVWVHPVYTSVEPSLTDGMQVALQLAVAALCLLLVPGASAAFGRSLLNAASCGSLGEPCCTQGDSLGFFCDDDSRLLCDTVNVASDAAPACVSCGGDGETPCGATLGHCRCKWSRHSHVLRIVLAVVVCQSLHVVDIHTE